MISINKFVCCMLVLVIHSSQVSAQLYDKLIKECYKMNAVFADTGYQRFTINYYFSTEKKPAVYTDSLTASLKVHRGNYYGKFRSEEYMQNKQYLITVYTSNESIMVSNPLKRNTSLVAIANLDSAFLASDIDSAWITESGQARTIKFRFTPASGYKSYTITYNKTNYQVQKIMYALKQQAISPDDTTYMPSNPLITIKFSDYIKTSFSDDIYDESKYVIKDSTGQYKGAGNYKTFEVLSTYQVPDTSNATGFLGHDPANKTVRQCSGLKDYSIVRTNNGLLIHHASAELFCAPHCYAISVYPALLNEEKKLKALHISIKHLFNDHI